MIINPSKCRRFPSFFFYKSFQCLLETKHGSGEKMPPSPPRCVCSIIFPFAFSAKVIPADLTYQAHGPHILIYQFCKRSNTIKPNMIIFSLLFLLFLLHRNQPLSGFGCLFVYLFVYIVVVWSVFGDWWLHVVDGRLVMMARVECRVG